MLRIMESSELEVPHLIEVVRTSGGCPREVEGATEDEEGVEESLEHVGGRSQPGDGIRADAKRSFDDEDEDDSDVDFDDFDDEEDEFEADDDEEEDKDDFDDEEEDEDDFDDLDDDLDEDE
jgi:hypothetical protein